MNTPTSRRPLASRNTKMAERLSTWLTKRNVTPNHISQASMVFAAIAGLSFWLSLDHRLWLILAAIGIQLRLLCNLMDGMVAVEGGKGSPTGAYWNEVPDRFSDAFILVGVGYAAGAPALGWAATAGAIMTAYLREAASAQGMNADFSGPMAKPQRMALATIAAVIALFLPFLGSLNSLEIALWVMIIGIIATIWRRSKNYLTFLKQKNQSPLD